MTLYSHASAYVTCDEPGCDTRTPPIEPYRVRGLLRSLRGMGWAVVSTESGWEHYCPGCNANRQEALLPDCNAKRQDER